MESITSRLRSSASVKVLVIGGLVLALLIPLAMIKGVIQERDGTSQSAWHEIQQMWGNHQLIAGPILGIPYDDVQIADDGTRTIRKSTAYVLPDELSIAADVGTETRYRGIYEVPVYTADIALHGRFSASNVSDLAGADADIHWDRAYVAIAVSDARAISEIPNLQIGAQSIRFDPGGQLISGLPTQIIAPLGDDFDRIGDQGASFETTINVKGSGSLQFLPLGDTTHLQMQSSWSSPSFFGDYLPETHEISDAGFKAVWRVSSIGRSLPSRWTEGSSHASSAVKSAFGVQLYTPISVYRLTLRATKYGVLIVGLAFVSFFAFEVVAGLRLHVLQYLLVGFANVLFYLLLISLAEHIGFGLAYLLSCAASGGLIIGYSRSVLGSRGGAGIMAIVLTLLYCSLYMTLKAQNYALVAGSIGLWATLALVMYLTRRVDWHSNAKIE